MACPKKSRHSGGELADNRLFRRWASINELLPVALAQGRLAKLVGQMEQEARPASPEAYDRVLAQWFEVG